MIRFVRGALAALILAVASGAHALPFTSLTLFGDSLSDTGNAFLAINTVTTPPFPLVPSAPYPRPGLFPALSNGPIWAEAVGSALGLPVLPSLAGGTNYAFAGADSGPLPGVPAGQSPTLTQQFFAPAFPPPPAAPQFPLFGGGPIVPTELYAVWGGGNDIRTALGVYQAVLAQAGPDAALAAASAVVSAGVANVANILGALAQGGAQHVLALNAPDVGLAPAVSFLPPGTADLASGLSNAFNLGLATAIDAIESAFMLDVIEVDTFGLVRSVAADPAAFGLANATDTCVQVGGFGTCADPDSYFFWDGIHPTAAGHQIIANAVLEALQLPVPAPGTAVLLLIGAFGLTVGARRSPPRAEFSC